MIKKEEYGLLAMLCRVDVPGIPAMIGRVKYELNDARLSMNWEAVSLQQLDTLAFDLQRLGRLLQIYIEIKTTERGEK